MANGNPTWGEERIAAELLLKGNMSSSGIHGSQAGPALPKRRS